MQWLALSDYYVLPHIIYFDSWEHFAELVEKTDYDKVRMYVFYFILFLLYCIVLYCTVLYCMYVCMYVHVGAHVDICCVCVSVRV